jgi:hypothetical protein
MPLQASNVKSMNHCSMSLKLLMLFLQCLINLTMGNSTYCTDKCLNPTCGCVINTTSWIVGYVYVCNIWISKSCSCPSSSCVAYHCIGQVFSKNCFIWSHRPNMGYGFLLFINYIFIQNCVPTHRYQIYSTWGLLQVIM